MTNPSILKIQSDDAIMCEFYCIAFIKSLIAGKIYVTLNQFGFSKMTNR